MPKHLAGYYLLNSYLFSDNTSQDTFPVPVFIMTPFVVIDISEFGGCITHMPYDIRIFLTVPYGCFM